MRTTSAPIYLAIAISMGFGHFALGDILPTILSSKTQKFTNSNCQQTDSCDLLSFEITTDQYRVGNPKADGGAFGSYNTKMLASYQTKNKAALTKYGIAQFVQGCQFMSEKRDGAVTNHPYISRHYRGKWRHVFFPTPMLEGNNPDPLSWNGDPALPRHYSYLTRDPGVTGIRDADRFGVQPPKQNRLFIFSRPGGPANYDPETRRAYNSSMKFKICIYKSEDVPKDVAPDDLEFAKPIHCFDWSSSYVYNFKTGHFESKPELDPYCKTQGETEARADVEPQPTQDKFRKPEVASLPEATQ